MNPLQSNLNPFTPPSGPTIGTAPTGFPSAGLDASRPLVAPSAMFGCDTVKFGSDKPADKPDEKKDAQPAAKKKFSVSSLIAPAFKLAIAGGLTAAGTGAVLSIVGSPIGIGALVLAAGFGLWALKDVWNIFKGGKSETAPAPAEKKDEAAAPEGGGKAENAGDATNNGGQTGNAGDANNGTGQTEAPPVPAPQPDPPKSARIHQIAKLVSEKAGQPVKAGQIVALLKSDAFASLFEGKPITGTAQVIEYDDKLIDDLANAAKGTATPAS